MYKITDNDIKIIIDSIKKGESLPAKYKEALFWKEIEKKEYELRYAWKDREEDIVANTYTAPLQKVKTFHPDEVIEHKDFIRESETKVKFDGWYNKLIFWDNLQVLKTLLTDELLQKQIRENGGIKLIYIDPPFATKQDFQAWKWEKAYTDKIAWSEFIEFIRKRLLLMRELLADDGSIYVHLDWKKAHYIKLILDEIFWESNFRNDIVWEYQWSWVEPEKYFPHRYQTIFFYSKNKEFYFKRNYEDDINSSVNFNRWYEYIEWNKIFAKNAPFHDARFSTYVEKFKKEYKRDPKWNDIIIDFTWSVQGDVWYIKTVDPKSPEKIAYPTQKPELLLQRIIEASSVKWDIVLDAFSWSGTTLAVAEKLWRKWIGIDGWKLAIYTIQNRLMNLKADIWNKWKLLAPKPFAVYNAGLYDFQILKNLDWDTYIWFTLSLFQCKQERHVIDGIPFDGYLNLYHVQVFDYNHGRQGIVLDKGYIENIDMKIGDKIGWKMYIIVPATKIDGILEDVIYMNGREYWLLRVPYSIIKELYTKEFSKIKQPTSEDDVNNTIEAVWFDFIRIPTVQVEYSSEWWSADIKILKFESKIISSKDLEYKNLESLSMIIIDYNYNWKYVNFEKVFFADEIKKNDYTISLDPKKLKDEAMIIYIDIFGNEKKEKITISNFHK